MGIYYKNLGVVFIQTAIIDFEKSDNVKRKGVAGVTHPWKDFWDNKQTFKVYKKKQSFNF